MTIVKRFGLFVGLVAFSLGVAACSSAPKEVSQDDSLSAADVSQESDDINLGASSAGRGR